MAIRFTINLASRALFPALSRDGKRLVYTEISASGAHLALRMMDQLESKPIPGSAAAYHPTFSPDGQWIAYTDLTPPTKLKKIPVTGGTPIVLCDDSVVGVTWGDDDTIIFSSSKGLMRVPAAGGTPQTVTTLDTKNGESGHYDPQILPGGQAVLFTIAKGRSLGLTRIAVVDLKTHTQRIMPNAGSWARYVPTGHVVYSRGGTLFAVPFDLKSLAVTGAEFPVVEGIDSPDYTFSDSGLLVFDPGSMAASQQPSTLEWMDRKGTAQPLPEPPHLWEDISLSPDGKRAAAGIDARVNSDAAFHEDIWLYEPERGTLTRLTFEGSNDYPVWSPDGKWVTFSSHRGDKSGIYRVPADASRQPELLVTVASSVFPFSWTPDGKTLLYMQHVGEKSQILMLTPPANGGESKPRLFLESAFGGLDPKVSPDGKWVAYADSNEGAANGEVFVVPLAGPGGKFQISTQGGTRPAWSHDGRELYYEERATLRVMAADIRTGPPFVAGRPQPLFKLSGLGAEWEPAPDGKRFLVERIPERTTTFVVVTNWFADLKK